MLEVNFLELRQCEVRSAYIRVSTFLGARHRKNEIVGTIAEPRIKRRTSDLLDPYTIASTIQKQKKWLQ
jgi:hypothetical protein